MNYVWSCLMILSFIFGAANGKISETGTHDELIEKNGFYADIYNAQFATPEDEDLVFA